MSKKNKEIRKRNEEIRILKKNLSELKTENNNLVLTNENLKNRINELKQQLKYYFDADKNQLTAKEDFKISMPFFVFIFATILIITFISLKNETTILGYHLAVISLIISIISTLFDLARTLLNKHTFKKQKIISFTINIEKSNSILYGLMFIACLAYTIYWIYVKPIPNISKSNFICSVTLCIYFLGLFINKCIK